MSFLARTLIGTIHTKGGTTLEGLGRPCGFRMCLGEYSSSRLLGHTLSKSSLGFRDEGSGATGNTASLEYCPQSVTAR